MKKNYSVHSAHFQPTPVRAMLNGIEVDAVVSALEIQLVPSDSGSGTIKLSYTSPEDIASAQAVFMPGAEVTIDFSQTIIAAPAAVA